MADVLVHVIDASNPMWGKQVNAVEGVLEEMGCGGKGVVRVYNKIDLLEEGKSERAIFMIELSF